MAFVRTKKIGGELYRYLVESYRDKETGKVRQRHLQYLGKVGDIPDESNSPVVAEIDTHVDPTTKPVRVVPTIGDWVEFKSEHGRGGLEIWCAEANTRAKIRRTFGLPTLLVSSPGILL